MTEFPLTKELLARAQAKLEKAEQALAANPANEWLQKAVFHERDKVASFRCTLSGTQPE